MLLLTLAGRSEVESFLASLNTKVKPKGKDVVFYGREVIRLIAEREKLLVKKKNIKGGMRKLKEKLDLIIDEIQEKDDKINQYNIKINKAREAAEMEDLEEPDHEPMQE